MLDCRGCHLTRESVPRAGPFDVLDGQLYIGAIDLHPEARLILRQKTPILSFNTSCNVLSANLTV